MIDSEANAASEDATKPTLTEMSKDEAEREWPRLLTTESSMVGSGAHQTSG